MHFSAANGDAEAVDLAIQLQQLLTEVGWGAFGVHGVYFQGSPPVGIVLRVHRDAQHAEALYQALQAAALDEIAVLAGADEGWVRVEIGRKPSS